MSQSSQHGIQFLNLVQSTISTFVGTETTNQSNLDNNVVFLVPVATMIERSLRSRTGDVEKFDPPYPRRAAVRVLRPFL